MEILVKAFLAVCVVCVCSLGLCIYRALWLLPQRTRSELRRQGIGGPTPSFPYGNLAEIKRLVAEEKARPRRGGAINHDYQSAVFPYYEKWRKEYGPVFAYTMGKVVMLHVSRGDLVREMGLCVSLRLGKGTYLRKTHEPLFGRGILKSNGPAWAHQRKLIAPHLFSDKVKTMMDMMVESAYPLLKSWEDKVEQDGGAAEVTVDDDLRTYSADVISRACFGSSYVQGKGIFAKLRALHKAIPRPNMFAEITGFRYFPTKHNREVWKLNREVRSLILNIVKEGTGQENNLLHAILCGASSDKMNSAEADNFIVDNCKNIYFAGHESTAITAAWTLMLLGLHPEWQSKARAEVAEVCGWHTPNAQSLPRLKILTMVILETLRLYPPGAFLSREALQEVKFGGIHIPRGVNIYVPVSTLHHDPQIWGSDVHEFNPRRFANGLTSACQLPHMYAPFGAGARMCLGQTFAMVELKIVLALMLRKFTFSLSPRYHHSPTMRLIVEPEFGVDLILKKVG